MSTVVEKIGSGHDLQECFAIRKQVFIIGQNVPENEDFDGKDTDSEHYIVRVNEQAVGTARIRRLNHDAKIERVAVLETHQGQGLGKLLMRTIISDLKCQVGINRAFLGAQTHAIPFYEGLGFVICSEEYLDAGIPHQDMQLEW